ncbi:GWxTD domain-containing protein [Pontibacter rugosus]|uniref:GWxTD domain-containing protein n=1 Tax=Pontibacter rugosus TaxID=1745966 RepID=A0ABW3SSF1_9BACT
MKYLHLLSILSLVFIYSCGGPSNTSLGPVQLKQEIPEITMEHAYYSSNDTLHLLIKFEDVQQVLDLLQSATSYEYAVRTGTANNSAIILEDSVNLPDRKITDVEGQLHVQVVLPSSVVQGPNVLHIQVWQVLTGQERVGMKFKLPLTTAMLRKDYLLVHARSGKPVFKDYVTTSDQLVLRKYGSSNDSLRVEQYELDFMPAAPPMSTRKPVVPRTISAASVFNAGTRDTIKLAKEGLYTFGAGSETAKSMLVMPHNYPQVTMADELVPPLIYLTTSREREALLKSPDVKAAVDNFWLEVGEGNSTQARELIRTYYNRVEMANKLFTAHKAGWATDRGMIYLVYGRPSSISQVGPNITWIYRESMTSPYIKFVFTKKENNFTENYYELVRRREYEDSWYSSVAKWRAGKTNL